MLPPSRHSADATRRRLPKQCRPRSQQCSTIRPSFRLFAVTDSGLPSPRNPSFSTDVLAYWIAFLIQRYTGRRQGTRNNGIGINHSAARTHSIQSTSVRAPRQIPSLLLAAFLSRYLSFRSLMRMPFRSALAIHSARYIE